MRRWYPGSDDNCDKGLRPLLAHCFRSANRGLPTFACQPRAPCNAQKPPVPLFAHVSLSPNEASLIDGSSSRSRDTRERRLRRCATAKCSAIIVFLLAWNPHEHQTASA